MLVLGLFTSVLLLWCAWTLLVAWQGVCRQRLSWQSFGAVAARSCVVVLHPRAGQRHHQRRRRRIALQAGPAPVAL
ncbi:hypothetical protein [Atlantibacter hermannii]|uniref:hypothetical protein n=1 Tax=Atlantibacter hermannii TaxID=565 RepID=UPI00289B700C|nr:hypothetical protein [Atlantibacter hermannii]